MMMNLRYKIKKKWFGFWQRYKLEDQLKITSKLFLVFLIVWLIASILTILSQWAFADAPRGSLFQKEYLKYFWSVIIELISGFDVPDEKLALNTVSQILTVIVLINGVVLLAIFTGQIVSMFIHMLQRMNHFPEKPANFSFKRPVIICGINEKLYPVIEELRKSCLTENREIVVIDEHADELKILDKHLHKDVWYIKGKSADRSILEIAIGENQTSAIILAADGVNRQNGRFCDSRAIETAMAIEGFKEKTHTVLELLDESNIPHLQHTKIDEWISISDYGIKLTSQAALQHGLGQVFHYLLGGGSGATNKNQIFITYDELPVDLTGRKYEEVRDMIMAEAKLDITLIGFSRYVPPGMSQHVKQDTGFQHLPYIKQLNPVHRGCRTCGTITTETDRLGRVQKMCQECFAKEKKRNANAENPWFFPVDTLLNREDRLIYLGNRPVNLKDFFNQETNRRS